jgi:hypothetical protein
MDIYLCYGYAIVANMTKTFKQFVREATLREWSDVGPAPLYDAKNVFIKEGGIVPPLLGAQLGAYLYVLEAGKLIVTTWAVDVCLNTHWQDQHAWEEIDLAMGLLTEAADENPRHMKIERLSETFGVVDDKPYLEEWEFWEAAVARREWVWRNPNRAK